MFIPNVGSIEPIDGKFVIVIDNIRNLGELYIPGEDLKKMMTAYGADIKFKQRSRREGERPFTGTIGRAYRSKSGRALNLTIENTLYSVSMATFQSMLNGKYTAVGISRYEDDRMSQARAMPAKASF